MNWQAVYAERERRDRVRSAIAEYRLSMRRKECPELWLVLVEIVMDWRHKHKKRPYEGDMGCGLNAIDDMGGYQSNAYREYEEIRA